jgi:hypothetical protein
MFAVCTWTQIAVTANWGLDNSSYRAKTEFNNCFIIYLKNSKQTEALYFICIMKKQFLSPSVAVVVVISMASASQYDTLWRHFANMNVKNPYLVSHCVDMTISKLAVSQSETRNFLNTNNTLCSEPLKYFRWLWKQFADKSESNRHFPSPWWMWGCHAPTVAHKCHGESK